MSGMERTELVKVRCTPEEKRRFQELAKRETAGDVSKLIRRRVFSNVEERPVEEFALFGADEA